MAGHDAADTRTLLRNAFLKLKELQGQVDAAERERHEPIAIVGTACRFPGGVTDVESLWALVRDGVDAITDVPAERWPAEAYYDPAGAAPGTMRTRWGGFLDDVDRFDAAFFGIAPREAAHIDPQQRIWLEVAWEALESAGQVAEHVAGSRTGVWAGVCASDYMRLALSDPKRVDPYDAAGGAESMVANRLSYLLDLQGPSVSVDTACSSALVAVHLACQSLRRRECDLALAGGVSLILAPEITISLSGAGMLAPDGRCKTFDARADGYVRGEGCGVVVLKRVSDALAAGDRIRAVIRGSAVNQDGRSNGLTAPNPAAQKAVLRAALADAGVAPSQVTLLEAHGTGTMLGDPVEIDALSAVYGAPRPADQVCALSAVKANIGHLEGAAGIAGLLKLVAVLEHGAIPPQVHFRTLNPNIALAGTPFVIPTTLLPWPECESPRCAGVSSFGFGGTNAHVIVEQAPPHATTAPAPARATPSGRAPAPPSGLLLPISARHPAALRSLARAYAELLASEDAHDVCYSAALRRTHHPQRLAATGDSVEEVRGRLCAYANGEGVAGVAFGHTDLTERRPVVFVFSGQGSHQPGSGRELMAVNSVFRETIDACDCAMRPHASWSLHEELLADAARSRLSQTEIAQPLTVAVQIALAAVWRSWGITPAMVIGHSVGEIAAAHVAGALGLAEAMRLACERGRAMQPAHGCGQMAAVELGPDEADLLVSRYGDALSVAAYNSSRQAVLSGDAQSLSHAMSDLAARGVRHRVLDAPYAFHSTQVQSAAAALERALSGLTVRSAEIPIVSTVTGQTVDGAACDAAYWARQIVAPVRFADAVATTLAHEDPAFLEIGGHPVLGGSIEQCLASCGRQAPVLGSLRRGRSERGTLLQALGHLYANGTQVNWAAVHESGGRCVRLPLYPWQRSRHWLPARTAFERRADARPLLGRRVDSPVLQHVVFETDLSTDVVPFLADHRIEGLVVVPAVVYLQMAFAAATAVFGDATRDIHDLVLREALVLPDARPRSVQTILSPEGENQASFQVVSRVRHDTAGDGGWRVHATGRIATAAETPAADARVSEEWQASAEHVDPEAFYQSTADIGFQFGTSFRGIKVLQRSSGGALGLVTLPEIISSDSAHYTMHPAMLDACLQVAIAALPHAGRELHVPFAIDRVRGVTKPTVRTWSHVRLRDNEAGATIVADVRLFSDAGHVVGEVEGLRMRRLTRAALLEGDSELLNRWTHEISWQRQPRRPDAARAEAGGWILLADRGGTGAALADLLAHRGDPVHVVHDLAGLEALPRGQYRALVHLWSLDTVPQPEEALQNGCGTLLRVGQWLAGADGFRARLWVITQAAQAPGPDPDDVAPAQTALWGLGRVMALEHPEMWGGLIDIGEAPGRRDLECVLDEIAAGDAEDQVAIRGGKRYVARLARRKESGTTGSTWSPSATGTYLITGGLGALGLLVARWLVQRGARQLLLAGRNPPTDSSRAAVAALREAGADVTICQADVSAPADVDRILEQIAQRAPLSGVVHAAGVVDDAVVERQDRERWQRAVAGKALGAWKLHERTRTLPLDCFVLFSSAVSVVGAPGQASYAAANAFLDGLAHRRRSMGLPVTCINWGPWDEAGMAFRDANRWRARGIDMIPPSVGLQLLELALRERWTQTVMLSMRWNPKGDASRNVRSLRLSELVSEGTGRTHERHAMASTSVLAALADALPGDRQDVLRCHLRQLTLSVIGLDPATELDDHHGFTQLGMDSLMALELRTALQASLQRPLPPTLAFDYPNVGKLSEYLALQLGVLGDGVASDPIAALLEQIKGLSLEELARLDGQE